MATQLILASASKIRRQLLEEAGVALSVETASVDEEAIKASLISEGANARSIADALAEFKARRVAQKRPDAIVLGCDQTLEFQGNLLSKPQSRDDARQMLLAMRGKTHKLYSAAVIYEEAKPVWRSVGQVSLAMRHVSDAYIDDYVDRNWKDIKDCVGCYQIEAEGARLFARIEGDYFTVLGMPLLDVLGFLTLKGLLEG